MRIQQSKDDESSSTCAKAALALILILLLSAGTALASVTASISGTVRDTSGAVVVGATVTATNTETGIVTTLHTNEQGYYSFQSLALGHYDINVEQTGFTPFHETGLVLDVNSALVVDVEIKVGEVKQAVSVTSSAVHVETATTQLGEVITSQNITSVPLVSRSYTDLLALQPGVGSANSGIGGGASGAVNSGSNFQAAGFYMNQVSGSENPGNVSVNGMRESENGYLLNGAIVQEFGFGGTSVIPNLDSLAEFRIITNNFDAEYGNYSGGQINVITKQGTNQLHGDVFEFLRNTDVDARSFFDPSRGSYQQNQFGGTLGGPIKRDKIFFFGDYQGNRVVQGVSSGLIPLPSAAERGGDFSQVSAEMAGSVTGAAFASQLQSELGYPVTSGEPYYTLGCTSTSNCVFPNAKIPKSAFSQIAQNIMPYIPPANSQGTFSTSGYPLRLRDDKGSGRVDANTHFGMLSAYYFWDDYALANPYTVSSNVPGFGSASTGKTQTINLGVTKSIGNATVNEARFQFVRSRNGTNPKGGTGVTTLAKLGFTGLSPLDPAIQGVPETDFDNFELGVDSRGVGITENTWQGLDNLRKVVGKHTISVGANWHFTQLQEKLLNVMNGDFQFFGLETGIDFADFLLGAPTDFEQGEAFPVNARGEYFGAYGQDSWRAGKNWTLNFGTRWEVSTPWWEQNNELETIIPGEQSQVYPNSPAGWVFPGDPNVPRTLAPTRYNNFAPRVGLAYSPSGGGWLGKLTGNGLTSIRAGYGVFFSSFQGASNFNEIGDAPYGDYASFTTTPGYANPYLNRSNGDINTNPFPVTLPIPKNINFAAAGFVPIGSSPGFYYKNRLPYAEEYDFAIQRQLSPSTLLTVSYVGTQGHRLFSTMEANPGMASICNYLNAHGASPTCGPGGESEPYVLPPGVATAPGAASVTTLVSCGESQMCNQVNGTRTWLGANFTTDGYFITNGQSAYNSLQVNLKRTAKSLTFLAGYTYGKSLDDSSAYGEQVNPFDPSARALSAFDQRNNFVLSYQYVLPFGKLGGPKRLTSGWQLSGITRFSTGLPVDLYELDDNSLTGTEYAGPLPIGVDTPVFLGKSIHRQDIRKTGYYFDPAQFSTEPIGTIGGSRRFFSGPGINNWDMALLKDTQLNERMRIEIRAEFFNVVNHAQFMAVNANINAPQIIVSGASQPEFGTVLGASAGRIGQFSLKFYF
jgi:hypothetical protein